MVHVKFSAIADFTAIDISLLDKFGRQEVRKVGKWRTNWCSLLEFKTQTMA